MTQKSQETLDPWSVPGMTKSHNRKDLPQSLLKKGGMTINRSNQTGVINHAPTAMPQLVQKYECILRR